LLSFELDRRCAEPLFFLRVLELDFFAEADVAQHVVHQDLAMSGASRTALICSTGIPRSRNRRITCAVGTWPVSYDR
jgi:hypothetical protein